MKALPASPCPLCGGVWAPEVLNEAAWIAPEHEARLAREHPGWRRVDGACPRCLQQALLESLMEGGEAGSHPSVQRVWPLDARSAFGALPTPLRLHADPRRRGRGTTIAIVDSGFHPHPDLTLPRNRIRAWVDASRAPLEVRRFGAGEQPSWPGASAASDAQWHGLMTSVVAAGNGTRSHGLYRGIASEADVVLVQVRGDDGRIGNHNIARALGWLAIFGPELGVKVVSLSLGGDAVTPLAGNAVDESVASLVARGIVVTAAAGNDGVRRLVPPATAPSALTIGGLDDRNTLDPTDDALWHGNYGEAANGVAKPELVAPSLWVAAPVLPGTGTAREALAAFELRARGDAGAEERIAALKLVTPHYQHVEGTSFASPIVASVVACMIEANPDLSPRRVRELLIAAAHPVPGAPPERQGAGALDAGRAVTLAQADRHRAAADFETAPLVRADAATFLLHDHDVREVTVVGSWDRWKEPGTPAVAVEPGLWEAHVAGLAPGRYVYKFRLGPKRWLTDPGNPWREHDGLGGWNGVFVVTGEG